MLSIAGSYGVTDSALHRHKASHLPAALAKGQEAAEIANGDNLLAQVTALSDRAQTILDTAEESGQLDTALRAIRESRACFELLAKLVGQLDERPVVNVTLSPQWVELRAVIVQTLAPYPDARQAVAQALLDVERGQ